MRENIRQVENDWLADAAIKSMGAPKNIETDDQKKELFSTDESPRSILDKPATSMAELELQKQAIRAEQIKQRELEKVRRQIEGMKS